jgi:hypothetical protein
VYGAKYHLRIDFTQVVQRIFQHTLLDRDLCRYVQVLHRATTADTKIQAPRLGAQWGFAQELRHISRFPLGLSAVGLEADSLTGKRAVDKNYFSGTAVLVGEMAHATRFHVKGLDVEQAVVHKLNGEKRGLIQRLGDVILPFMHGEPSNGQA